MKDVLNQEPVAWVDSVMDQAQIFASCWSLVGGCFDSGNGLEDAEQAKAELRAMLTTPPTQPAPVQPVAQWQKRHPERTDGKWENANEHDAKWWRDNVQGWEIRALYTTPPAAQPAMPLTDEDRAILEAVRREMDEDDDGNAPGHRHQITGVWDDDNGELAGKPCAWCLTWKKFTALIEREAAHGITPPSF